MLIEVVAQCIEVAPDVVEAFAERHAVGELEIAAHRRQLVERSLECDVVLALERLEVHPRRRDDQRAWEPELVDPGDPLHRDPLDVLGAVHLHDGAPELDHAHERLGVVALVGLLIDLLVGQHREPRRTAPLPTARA